MRRNRIMGTALAALALTSAVAFNAFAQVPSGTAVIGTKAYDLNYLTKANAVEMDQIRQHIVSGQEIYVKDFGGNWVNNSDLSKVSNPSTVIPEVVYKDISGNETTYEAGDGNEVSNEDFQVIGIE